jgi:two-component system, NarL family, nitrate/nitrite response regulator NarL
MQGALVDTKIVWLIDAHPLLRSGLRAQLEGKGFEVAAEGGTVAEISRNGDAPAPHLIILDFAQGSDAVAGLKTAQPQARTVVFAESAEIAHLADMFSAGADGYLLKSISANALIESLKLVALGEKVFPSMLTDFLGAMRSNSVGGSERVRVGDVALSQRELDIIRRLADGHSNKSIAKDLSITEATVKVHLKTVLRKLGATNRTQVAIWAVQHGLTNPNSNGGARTNGRHKSG